ncbi:UDP-glucuronosyltransferase 2B1 [Eumeta japonica]|uniref:UDP-glucuronosyltransferase 2B1 n=1 Tax=Eumeta variegata TaxID=151549 RepID=A0A4C1U5I6_EUMVA|nr:UDP-glucuronosyltransferase 2B1 [Eumeta japonica]
MDQAVHKGYDIKVDYEEDLAKPLKVALDEMLNKPSYAETAKRISAIFHDVIASPRQELVHWVEHVARTQGAPYLRSIALHVPWYQKIYLDLIAVTTLNNDETFSDEEKVSSFEKVSSSENDIRKARTTAAENLVKQAKKMKATSDKSHPPANIGNNVTIPIPNVDKGKEVADVNQGSEISLRTAATKHSVGSGQDVVSGFLKVKPPPRYTSRAVRSLAHSHTLPLYKQTSLSATPRAVRHI